MERYCFYVDFSARLCNAIKVLYFFLSFSRNTCSLFIIIRLNVSDSTSRDLVFFFSIFYRLGLILTSFSQRFSRWLWPFLRVWYMIDKTNQLRSLSAGGKWIKTFHLLKCHSPVFSLNPQPWILLPPSMNKDRDWTWPRNMTFWNTRCSVGRCEKSWSDNIFLKVCIRNRWCLMSIVH